MRTLTILNRLDIDFDYCFTAVSVGFNIHKRGIQMSLLFFDISFFYFSPAERLRQEERYKEISERLRKWEEQA